MNLNYAIFRSEPIYTTNDLAQIGSHNKRDKKEYKSNPDIDINKSQYNIDLVPLQDKYVKKFYDMTKEYKKEHDERMKTERPDRKRTFSKMVNESKNVVADELLFTASPEFFYDKSRDEIIRWANTCMDFVYKDLGYTKEQVLHATVHMDEKTPHIHCVVVPLVKKYDKRTNTERFTISKKQYIKDKKHLSELQDKYCVRLNKAGFKLERGIKNSDKEHLDIKEFKKITRNMLKELDYKNEKFEKAVKYLDESMKASKSIIFDKDHVKVTKETFDNMNDVIKQARKIKEIEPKVVSAFNKVDNFTSSKRDLEIENNQYKNEIDNLREKNQRLERENRSLKDYIVGIVQRVKEFFRKILLRGNEVSKDIVSEEIKKSVRYNGFNQADVYGMAKLTTKERELFSFSNIPSRFMSNSSEINSALNNINNEMDKSAKEFSRLFEEDKEKSKEDDFYI